MIRHLWILLAMTTVLTIMLAADTVKYTYDDAGRLTTVAYSNGTTIGYTYDNAGNLLSRTVSNPNTNTARTKKKQPSRNEPVSR